MTPQPDTPKSGDVIFTKQSSIGIKVSNLSKTFSPSCMSLCCKKSGLVKACDDISFEVKKDQLVTILGQNGAGKTTLINMLTGFLEPSWGEAWLAGNTLSDDIKQIREITSLCPQFDIYWPDLTIEEHLEIFSIIKGLHKKKELKREVARTLELVGLTNKKDERVQFLSGGMRRRLAIGISTISDPKIIFFDEPTTGLDPVTKDNILKLIKGNWFFFI
jgi:ATP-binding cassette subfamily A (ABC1) protein 3